MIDQTVLPALLTALATLVTAITALISVLQNGRRLRQIDHAVNGRPPSALSIKDQIEDLASRLPASDKAAAKVIRDDEQGRRA